METNSRLCFNPCCGGLVGGTEPPNINTDIEVCFNPCCGGLVGGTVLS